MTARRGNAKRSLAPSDPRKILVGEFYSNYTHHHKQPPKSGFGFLEVVIGGVISRAGSLVEILDAPHQHGGNPGFPAEAMLSAYVMQFVLNERYANGFLNTLGSNDRLLGICSLEYAPSEGTTAGSRRNSPTIWAPLNSSLPTCSLSAEKR